MTKNTATAIIVVLALITGCLIGRYIINRAENATLAEEIAILKTKITSEPNEPKVWGQGDPPAEWQSFFGNDNTARLDYMQTQRINRIGQLVAELVERVRKLEEVKDAGQEGEIEKDNKPEH